ncbi:ribonuclease H-like domain-containing protein [Tanacetum coccineum]
MFTMRVTTNCYIINIHNCIVPDEEEVAVDAIPLATKPPSIVDWKIVKEGKISYYQIIRADGSSKRYSAFIQMLRSFDREDLETLWKLVKAKHGYTRPEEGYERVLWGDLKTMFEHHVEDAVWRNLRENKVLVWKLFDSCGVHFVRFQNLHVFMLVEKRYPLTPATITDMLNKKLQADHWNEMWRIVEIKRLFDDLRVTATKVCFFSQKKYALQLLERAYMITCNPSRTPIDTESKQVQQICLYMHDPREPHFGALKCILRYVQGTVFFGLQLYVPATTSLVGYTDADWAGCPSTRSAKAEYRGVANVVAEITWIRNLLRELHSPLSIATLVYCDNASAVYMSANPVQHQRTKHIEIDIYFVRDMVTAGHVRVLHVPSRFQYADIFTKGLLTALFEDFCSSLSVRPPPAQTAGAY